MSREKIPPIDPVTGKFVTPVSGNEVYETRQQVVDARISKKIGRSKFTELMNVYMEAIEDAPEYGFVGVGCISFAEAILQEHQDGVVRRIRIPTLYDEYSFKQESNDE